MGEKKDGEGKPSATNTTNIGHVMGPVHTGSGDINVDNLAYGALSNKDDFLEALRAFKAELEAARQRGLPEEMVDDATVEVEAAEKEAKKEIPKAERITKRLEQAKSILTAGAGVATATNEAVAATGKLLPLIQNAIHAVGNIFQ